MITRWIGSALCVFACLPTPVSTGQGAETAETLFPFVVSYETSENVTNIADWLHKPAGKYGPVRTQDGEFATDDGPIRFLGTNLCFDACFPSHEQAEPLARRLARFGINVVRMHHMDSRSIWGQSPDKLTIDPQQLERLDYLIWALKQQGIYTNLNLHVSRAFGPAEGFDDPQLRPKYDKGLGNFEPRMIALQKKYARDLLTHVNPYTQTAYTDEPALAFVEISNEDALFTEWFRGHLKSLPDPYRQTFRELWTNWLGEKYTTTARLRAAWSAGEQRLGKELLSNGDLSAGNLTGWNLEQDGPNQASWSIVGGAGTGPDSTVDEASGEEPARSLRIVVHRRGRAAWRPQLTLGGFGVERGRAYSLTLQVRADTAQSCGVNCMMAHEPWQRLGLATTLSCSDEWQTQQFTFVADDTDDSARLTFTGLKPGTYEFANVSLRPGGVIGLRDDESLESGIDVLARDQNDRTPTARADFVDFLWDLERDYWLEFARYLKEDLQLKALVSGTQLSYSPVFIQSQLDYIDAHAYWQHPRFPNRPWDRADWYVVNSAMVNAPGGTLVDLAARRVAGLPFTVSEYNHPAPLQYAAEGLPMLATMAGLQDWNGIYSFTWSHNTDFTPLDLTGFFDIKSDPGKLVHHPACAALFVRGDMPAAERTVRVPLTMAAERQRLHETGGDPWSLKATEFGVSVSAPLEHAIALQRQGGGVDDSVADDGFEPQRAEPIAEASESAGKTLFKSDNGALTWDIREKDRGVFLVDTERTKLLTGFVDGRPRSVGKVQLAVEPGELHWATLSLTCIDGTGFDAPGRILVAATGLQQNSGWQLEELGAERITLGRNWGQGPILCEGVAARIELPVAAARVSFFALDPAGDRREPIPVRGSADRVQFELSPEHKTLWYEIVIR